jgi:hypothetical protein
MLLARAEVAKDSVNWKTSGYWPFEQEKFNRLLKSLGEHWTPSRLVFDGGSKTVAVSMNLFAGTGIPVPKSFGDS